MHLLPHPLLVQTLACVAKRISVPLLPHPLLVETLASVAKRISVHLLPLPLLVETLASVAKSDNSQYRRSWRTLLPSINISNFYSHVIYILITGAVSLEIVKKRY